MTQSPTTFMDYQSTTLAQRSFMTKVYGWMSVGLIVTAAVAFLTASSPTMLKLVFGTPGVWLVLLIAQFGLVIALSAAVTRIPAGIATFLFVLYSALTGLTLAVVLLLFTRQSVFGTFLATSATFGAMSFYGYITKRDLTALGSFLIMALIGLVIASLVNVFFAPHNNVLYWLITYAGILIFVGLTAYDTQKIKQLYAAAPDGSALSQQLAISGALALYLDFINLFLLLLRLLGDRRR